MRLISDRVYSARLTAKVLLYQKMTFIFHEQLTFLNLPIPFFPHSPLHVHSSLYPIWFPSKRNHQRPMNIFKMSPERVALLLGRRLTATVHPAESHFRVGGRVGGEEAASLRPKSISIARPLKKHSALKSSSNTYHSQTIIPPIPASLWLLAVLTADLFFMERGPLKFDYYEPNPSFSSPACCANPLEAGCVL